MLECVDDTSNLPDDLFPHKVEPLHSDHWTITYHGTYKIVKNTQKEVSYLLYQCGTTPPASEEGNHHMNIPVPLQDGIGVTQTTYIPHIELLGKRTDISYIGNPQFISSPCLNELIHNDEAVEVVDGFNSTEVDAWLGAHPNSVILSNPWTDASLPGRMIISESSETASNKAVFEWHKVYAALYNLEHMGNAIFQETSDRYDCVSSNAGIQESDKEKPTILWGTYVDYYDSCSNTTTIGWSLGSCPNYYCEFASDCHATFMIPEEGKKGSLDCWGSPCMTDDEFFEFAKDADHWIYPSDNFNDVYSQKKSMLDKLPVVINQQVFDTYGSGPNTWFEQRMAEYDVVLEDMCKVVDTSPPGDVHKRKWFRNVFTEPLGELGVCLEEDKDKALKTQATECTLVDLTETTSVDIDESDSTSGAFMSSGGAFKLLITLLLILS